MWSKQVGGGTQHPQKPRLRGRAAQRGVVWAAWGTDSFTSVLCLLATSKQTGRPLVS